MSIGTAKAQADNAAVPAGPSEKYIQDQLDRTRAHVKLIDLCGGLMTLAAVWLTSLLVLAVIDAWVFELGWFLRLVALMSLIGFTAIFMIRTVGPLLIKQINPLYAAKMIEESRPSLKNSLINFLLIRGEKQKVRGRVLAAAEERAARDLSGITIESAVDRSHLIYVGYALAGIMIIGGAYKIFSPKDPFQTVLRIAAPLADIARPATVRITRIEPGDAEVFYGEPLEVVAELRGVDEGDRVDLIYSTTDGRQVDQFVPMIDDGGGGRFVAQLSTGSAGIQQDLKYHIRAGDAQSPDYEVTVRTRPTIVVEQINFQYPEYTGYPPKTLTSGEDIVGIEGTKVRIDASANLPIERAYIELLSRKIGSEARNQSTAEDYRVVATEPMTVSADQATGEFRLLLEPDRVTPKYSHFRLKFTAPNGERNLDPELYSISVIPDLAPEVEILEPADRSVELPADRSILFTVRAIDPDFEISRLLLRGEFQGNALFNQPLIDAGQPGGAQVNRNHRLLPVDYGLKPGDEFVVVALAEDNRQSPISGLHDPNGARTENITIRLVEPVGTPDPALENQASQPQDPNNASADENAGGEDQTGEGQSGEGQTGEGQTGEGQTGEGQTGQGQTGEGQTGEGQSGQGQTGEGQTGQGQTGEGQSGQGQTGEGQTGQGQTGEGQSGEGQTGQGQSGQGQSGQGQSGQGQSGSSQTGSGQSGAGQSGTGQSGEGQTGSGQSGAGQSGAGQSGTGQTSSGQPSGAESGQGASGDRATGSGGQSGGSRGTPSDAHDGERFEELQRYIEEQQSGSGSGAQQDQSGGANAGSSGQGESATGQSADQSSNAGGEGLPQESSGSGGSGQQQSGSGGANSQPDGGAGGGQQDQTGGGGSQNQDPSGGGGQQSGNSGGGGSQQDASTGGGEQQQSSGGGGAQDDVGVGGGGQNENSSGGGGSQQQQTGGSGGGSEQQSGSGSGSEQQSGGSGSDQQSGGGGGSEQQQDGGGGSDQQSGGGGGQQEQQQAGGGGGGSEQQSGGGGGQQQEQQSGAGGGQQPGGSGAGGQQPGGQNPGGTSGSGGGGDAGTGSQQSSGSNDRTSGTGQSGAGQSGAGQGEGPGQSTGQPDGQGQPGGNNRAADGTGQSGNDRSGSDQSGSQDSGQGDQSGNQGGQGSNGQGTSGSDSSSNSQSNQDGRSGTGTTGNNGQSSSGQPSDNGSSSDQTGGNPSDQGTNSSGEGGSAGNQSGGNSSAGGGASGGSSQRPGAGTSSSANNSAPIDPLGPGEIPEGEKANLEYSREATDLVLDYLEEQKEQPDPELLERMNWSEQDMRDFLNRWKEMKKNAQEGTATDRQLLDDRLRSLGLRPGRDRRSAVEIDSDSVQGLEQQGTRSRPPAEFVEGFRAFLRGTARQEDE